jgi:hypothetical protein
VPNCETIPSPTIRYLGAPLSSDIWPVAQEYRPSAGTEALAGMLANPVTAIANVVAMASVLLEALYLNDFLFIDFLTIV